ncbi:hypothetical protein OEZ71_20125 [Defluviimonas sp. WL0050]|uniref:Uncharacterized protein n=1 Tax=Albidovulum litorale TaxID=2984134 RepID=A0ABT2ZTX6_9RHOB|nr:hypothetical protein [Defluviimonas sp. WL0050]MCV2874613.1 hypothetical protein [Defluviimonas sp. WL0050]
MSDTLSGPPVNLYPGIRYRSEADRDAAFALFSQTLRVIEHEGTFHIEEKWRRTNYKPRVWCSGFDTERAAEMFRHDMILAAVDGLDNEACRTKRTADLYNLAGAVVDLVQERAEQSDTPVRLDEEAARDLANIVARALCRHAYAAEDRAVSGEAS